MFREWALSAWCDLDCASFLTSGRCLILNVSRDAFRLFENFAFMVGSAYFVAGSYPDGAMVIDDDFLDTSIEDEDEGGFYLK